MPQVPETVKSRACEGWRAGPPSGPLAVRVSRTRQGASVKNFPPPGAGLRVGVGVGVAVGVDVAMTGGVGVGVATGLGVRVGVDVGVAVGVRVGVTVGVRVGVGVGVATAVDVGVRVGVAVGVDVGVRVGVAVGVHVGVGVGVEVTIAVGVRVGVDVGVTVGVRVGVEDGLEVGVGVAPPLVYENAPTAVNPWLSGFLTRTSTRLAAWAPVVAAMEVEPVTLTPVAATPPIVTVAPETKFAPVIVTAVPPDVEPKEGETAVTTGPATVPKQDVRPSTYVRILAVTAALGSPGTPRNILMLLYPPERWWQ
jgi:hypothetical protein